MVIFKVRTINQVVIIVSSISAILDVIVAILHKTPWWAWIATGICTYFITYYISKFFLSQYVIFRIKPLYQLLLSKDIIRSRLSEELRKKVNNDLVDDIQENLNHLVAFNTGEIERLVQKEKEKSEFLASVCHEIRTPIFNIQGYTQTLLDGGWNDAEINQKFLERIMRSIDRLSDMIEDIDKISHYESGGVTITKEKFDIVDLVDEVIDTNVVTASERNIRFKVSAVTFPANEPIFVYADRSRITQVLNNLIVNAIKFSDDGGSIRISFIDMFDKILVEVRDKGIGIPPNDLPYIFEKLYRVDKSRSRSKGGSGLGLSIAKLIIDAHNENITVRSEVNVGSTFSFTLTKWKD